MPAVLPAPRPTVPGTTAPAPTVRGVTGPGVIAPDLPRRGPSGRARRRRTRLLPGLLLPALLLSACGGGSSGGAAAGSTPAASSTGSGSAGASTAPSGTFPVTVHGGNGSVTLNAAPHRIVSLSPTATEMLFAIGAGGQVVAVDSDSNWPASAPRTKLSGFQPNAEAVVGYRPDLVVISNDANGLLAALTKLSVPTLLLPAASRIADGYQQELTLGTATGHQAQAQQLVSSVQKEISAAVASVPKPAKPLSVYHELDQNYYSVTSSTFIGSLYQMFGLTNIADRAKGAAASGGYPKLSAEYVVTSSPDLIVIADYKCCGQTPAVVAKRPGFSALPAVKNDRVIGVDDDIASRWGPRVADFAHAIAKALGGR